MTRRKNTKLRKLFSRYKWYVIAGILLIVLCVVGALTIYQFVDRDHLVWHKGANFLVKVAEMILGAGLIGGGIGGGINFIFEEMKSEEAEAKERLKGLQEEQEKRKVLIWEMQNKLQTTYDNVELARVLIKSHKSAKTYGEQIRNHVIPSFISLQDFRRGLLLIEDTQLKKT